MSTISASGISRVDADETFHANKRARVESVDYTCLILESHFDELDDTFVVRYGLAFNQSTGTLSFRDDLTIPQLLECVKSLSVMKMHGESWLLHGTMSTLVQQMIATPGFSVQALFDYFVGDSKMAVGRTGARFGGGGITNLLESIKNLSPWLDSVDFFLGTPFVNLVVASTGQDLEAIKGGSEMVSSLGGVYDLVGMVVWYWSERFNDLGGYRGVFLEHLACVQVGSNDVLAKLLREDKYLPQTTFLLVVGSVVFPADVMRVTKSVGFANKAMVSGTSQAVIRMPRGVVFEDNTLMSDVCLVPAPTEDDPPRSISIQFTGVKKTQITGADKTQITGAEKTVMLKNVRVEGFGLSFMDLERVSLNNFTVVGAHTGITVMGTEWVVIHGGPCVGEDGLFLSQFVDCEIGIKLVDIANAVKIDRTCFVGCSTVFDGRNTKGLEMGQCGMVHGRGMGELDTKDEVVVVESFIALKTNTFGPKTVAVEFVDSETVDLKVEREQALAKHVDLTLDGGVKEWYECSERDTRRLNALKHFIEEFSRNYQRCEMECASLPMD